MISRPTRRPTVIVAALCLGTTSLVALAPRADAAAKCFGENATVSAGGRTIVGTGGDDVIIGTSRNEVIKAKGGDDLVCGGDGNDTVVGGGGDEVVDGQGGKDVLKGGGGSDILFGAGGNDKIRGGPGDADILLGSSGDDTLDGGPGNFNTADYSFSSSAVIVDLSVGTATGDGQDTLVNIGDVNGSDGNDTLRGNSIAIGNGLLGGPGNDTLNGAGGGSDIVFYDTAEAAVVVNLANGTAAGQGSDTLTEIEDVGGGPFKDTITGDAGENVLFGRDGDDDIFGGDGDDAVVGGLGDEMLDGQGGFDVTYYGYATGPVTVDIDAGTATVSGSDPESDSLVDVEDAIGTPFGDTLRGDNTANFLAGLGGSDDIFGEGGDDLLDGDNGDQTFSGTDDLDGGPGGNDTCINGETLTACESTTPPAAARLMSHEFAGVLELRRPVSTRG